MPLYEAFGENGPYLRPARRIGELPLEQRLEACRKITPIIERITGLTAERPIWFGMWAYSVFGITRKQAKEHPHAELLMTPGCDLPLSLLEDDNA